MTIRIIFIVVLLNCLVSAHNRVTALKQSWKTPAKLTNPNIHIWFKVAFNKGDETIRFELNGDEITQTTSIGKKDLTKIIKLRDDQSNVIFTSVASLLKSLKKEKDEKQENIPEEPLAALVVFEAEGRNLEKYNTFLYSPMSSLKLVGGKEKEVELIEFNTVDFQLSRLLFILAATCNNYDDLLRIN